MCSTAPTDYNIWKGLFNAVLKTLCILYLFFKDWWTYFFASFFLLSLLLKLAKGIIVERQSFQVHQVSLLGLLGRTELTGHFLFLDGLINQSGLKDFLESFIKDDCDCWFFYELFRTQKSNVKEFVISYAHLTLTYTNDRTSKKNNGNKNLCHSIEWTFFR